MTQFLIDAQLPPALARWLTARGQPSQHVVDFGGDGTTDDEVWAQALHLGAVIVSKDEDFALRACAMPAARRSSGSVRVILVALRY